MMMMTMKSNGHHQKQRHSLPKMNQQHQRLHVVLSVPTHGSGDDNEHDSDDASSLSFDGGDKYHKKSMWPTAVVLAHQRITLRFRMLSQPLQIILALATGLCMGFVLVKGTLLLIRQRNQGASSFFFSRPQNQQRTPTIEWRSRPRVLQILPVPPPLHNNNTTTTSSSPAVVEPISRHRRKETTTTTTKTRVVVDATATVTIVPLHRFTTRIPPIPELGSRELKDRYDPLPHLSGIVQLSPASELERDNCHRLADWQVDNRPTCNPIHESTSVFFEYNDNDDDNNDDSSEWVHHNISPPNGTTVRKEEQLPPPSPPKNAKEDFVLNFKMVANGAFRQVWMIREYDGTLRALKTLRYYKKSNFDLRAWDRHRRDALCMDELTASPLIVDIYGFCTNSALFDWGEGGDMSEMFERNKKNVQNDDAHSNNNNKKDPEEYTKEYLMEVAYNVSLSIAHAHHPDKFGRATIAHTDIKPNQFLYQEGYYKLTDFNRVRFLAWDDDANETCGFKVGANGGLWRSPEEYAFGKETEKVDVYSLGNILFFLVTQGINPWQDEDIESKEIYERVKAGKRPRLPHEIQSSSHVYERTMRRAIELCFVQDPRERASAQQVANLLATGLQEMGMVVPVARAPALSVSSASYSLPGGGS
jgi:Protein kinase domain